MKKRIKLDGIWGFEHKNKKTEIKVPSNWYLQGFDISGKAVYSRDFEIKKEKGKFYFINFTGVDYFCDVFINGKKAGSHEGYFQKFRFEITGLIKNGKNTIKAVVNSPLESKEIWPDKKILIKGIFNHHDARPGSWNKNFGQDKNTGGIWNSVFVSAADEIEILNVKITPLLKDDGVWNLQSEVLIYNHGIETVEGDLRCRMMPETFKGRENVFKKAAVIKKGLNSIVMYRDLESPRLWWSHDHGRPDLYRFRYELKASNGIRDVFEDTAGIREFKKGNDNCWYLNGRRIFIKGSNIIPTQWLSEYTPEKIKKDAALIKAANMNMIRIHAHVNREELYRELDRQGIMVWQDFALQWGYETTDAFMENAASQLKDMINMNYNRASIVIWCCHNEPFVNEKQLDPVLYRAAVSEDPVRYIEQASDFSQHPYQGWYYDDNFSNSASTFDTAEKAFLLTEYGAQALPCLSTMKKMFEPDELWPPDWEKWEYRDFQYKTTLDIAEVKMGNSIEEFIFNSQKYQADLISEQTETFRMRKYKKTGGLLHFMFCECWPSITWAVVDYYRKPKAGYEALRRAVQPVYPGYRLMTKKVSAGDILGFGILWKLLFVINDTHKELKNVRASVRLKDQRNRVYFERSAVIGKIEPDSSSFPFDSGAAFDSFDGDKFGIPRDARPGTHRMEITLAGKDGKKLGSNRYEFEVLPAVKRMKDQYHEDY